MSVVCKKRKENCKSRQYRSFVTLHNFSASIFDLVLTFFFSLRRCVPFFGGHLACEDAEPTLKVGTSDAHEEALLWAAIGTSFLMWKQQ